MLRMPFPLQVVFPLFLIPFSPTRTPGGNRPIRPLRIGIARDSVLAMFPDARRGTDSDFYDLTIPGKGYVFYLGFDTGQHLNYLTYQFCSNDVHQDASRLEQFEDTARNFTFSGGIRGWQVYWWNDNSGQILQAFKKDSEFDNFQAPSSLSNQKRRNRSFQVPGKPVRVFLPVMP